MPRSKKPKPNNPVLNETKGVRQRAERSDSHRRMTKVWNDRIRMANKVRDEWSRKFRVKELFDWYLGTGQWPDSMKTATPITDPYVINLIFPSVEVKIPSLYFWNPIARIQGRPSRSDDEMTTVSARAKLREDTLNTFIQDPELHLMGHSQLSMKEAFFSYGIIEVGYTADFIDNPNAEKPVLDDRGDPMLYDGKPIPNPAKIPNPDNPRSESLFIKRIPADQFRVSPNSGFLLKECDWCGYYEWHYTEDLKRNPAYSNTSKLQPSGRWSKESGGAGLPFTGEEEPKDRESDIDSKKGMTRIWKIWDQRTKTRFVLPDSQDFFLLSPEEYDIFPFAALKFHDQLNGWYPLPPVFNWLWPQQEYNETREAQRVHRRRFHRRYQVVQGQVMQEELDKLQVGGDGTIITVQAANAIGPILDAPLDTAIVRNLPQTKDDFMQISAVGGEQRGVPEATTATQASIVDTRTRIRESFARAQVANWLVEIFTIMLKTIEEKMELPLWVKINTDPYGPAFQQEMLQVMDTWRLIQVEEDFGTLCYDVSVELDTLSPNMEDIDKQNWIQVMQLFQNPIMVLVLSSSESLLRKTLAYFSIRDERQIGEIKKALQVVMLSMGAAGQMQQGQPGAEPGGGPQGATPGPTPGMAGIQTQLGAQMG